MCKQETVERRGENMLRTISGLWQVILNKILQMLGLGGTSNPDLLRIFIKTNLGSVIQVDLERTWDIRHVKELVAPKLGMTTEEVKIILAGKELHDSILIEKCDLGQHSILHAVRIVRSEQQSLRPDNNESGEGSEPLCESLMDLQLTEEERHFLQDHGDTEKRKAHFYVYCNSPCHRMQPGKLRVRCKSCHEGAFTVSRDPFCWEDVLTPQRVEGQCETEGCKGKWAEFYFKCAEHVSQGEDDRAVALYLIKSNFHDVSCLACGDVSDSVLVFQCAAAHVMCLNCFCTYCTTRLNDRQFVQDLECGYTLPCPAGCENSLIQEVHHFKLIGDEQYARYQKFGAEECLLQAGGVLCPQPGCGMGLLPDPECRRIQCENGCGFVFCRYCLQGYHLGECIETELGAVGVSTQQYHIDPTRAAQASWEDATRVTIRVMTKPCPQCRTPTERDGGCMHMVCTRAQCGFHWCWMCQTEWSRDCMGNHWFG